MQRPQRRLTLGVTWLVRPFRSRRPERAPRLTAALIEHLRTHLGPAQVLTEGDLSAWELWLAPTGSGTLALKVLPLALCLAGLLRHRMYTFRWLSMLVWLYFMEGATRAVTDSGISRWLAVAEVLLSIWLFAWSALYIRRRLRQAREAREAREAVDAAAAAAADSGGDLASSAVPISAA